MGECCWGEGGVDVKSMGFNKKQKAVDLDFTSPDKSPTRVPSDWEWVISGYRACERG